MNHCRICRYPIAPSAQVLLVGEDRVGLTIAAPVHRACLDRPIEEFATADAVARFARRRPEDVPEPWRSTKERHD